MPSLLNRLIAFLNAHSVDIITTTETTITVSGMYCRDGVAFSQPDVLPANLEAIRNYLGY